MQGYNEDYFELSTIPIYNYHLYSSIAALKQYNGIPLDSRPMWIEIARSEREIAAASTQPLRRVGGTGGRVGGTGGRVGRPRMDMGRRNPGPRPRNTGRGAGSGARGGSRGGRGGARKEKEPAKSKEDLDAEMDAYMNTKSA